MDRVLSVLLIEDHRDYAETFLRLFPSYLKDALRENNVSNVNVVMEYATTPDEAMEEVRNRKYDVYIIDTKHPYGYWPCILKEIGFFETIGYGQSEENKPLVIGLSTSSPEDQEKAWNNCGIQANAYFCSKTDGYLQNIATHIVDTLFKLN